MRIMDEAGVVAKFGVLPESIPDYLALVGDSADGFPGVPGWGAKSAATVLARFVHIEEIPLDVRAWGLPLRGADRLAAALRASLEHAVLFRLLATLRTDAPIQAEPADLRWPGPTAGFAALCDRLEAEQLVVRADRARQI
jgi:5'-3' exonuclease